MTKANKSYEFISFDGVDPSGTRAEVLVLSNTGKLVELKENAAKNVAMAKFSVPHLSHEIHGWLQMGTDIFDEVKRVQESGSDAHFRIEIQRKKNIARDIPISDLRNDMSTAKENIHRILTEVNGVFSPEALTNPKEDPVFDDGRYPAGDSTPATQSAQAPQPALFDGKNLWNTFIQMVDTPDTNKNIVEAVAALLIAFGHPVEEIHEALAGSSRRLTTPNPRTYKIEAPPYKEYNSDGRINLGSGQVASGVGIESFVSRNLLANVPHATPLTPGFDELAVYFTKLAYSIADFAQEKAYGGGVPADRGANSHTRVRGLFIDIAERYYSFPVAEVDGKLVIISATAVREWTANVGNEILKRFGNAIAASQSRYSFGELFNELKAMDSTEGPGQTQPVASEAPQASTEASGNASQPEQASAPTPQPESAPQARVESPEPASVETSEPSEATLSQKERLAKAQAALASVDADKVEAFRNETTNAAITPDEDENFSDDVQMEELGNGLVKMTLTPEIMAENPELADEDSLGLFKETLNAIGFNLESDSDRLLITKILKFTYGEKFSNAKMVPSVYLDAFSDWYASVEPEIVETLRVTANQI